MRSNFKKIVLITVLALLFIPSLCFAKDKIKDGVQKFYYDTGELWAEWLAEALLAVPG